jgi:tRNA wybutosine-synthesizing protein 3
MDHDLLPDFIDRPDDILPSFASIREKTLKTLYGVTKSNSRNEGVTQDSRISQDFQDKSPKGSVDAPIQALVDLINAHPSFSTLSSCSGRIAIFDPSGASEYSSLASNEDTAIVDTDNTESFVASNVSASGKGGGRWHLASHERVEPQIVLDIFPTSANEKNSTTVSGDRGTDEAATMARPPQSLLSFRFEPMLLHVASATLRRGQQLMQIALQLGFRESGLIVTNSRVTVAIRSYGLAMSVPLQRGQGPMQLSHDYLTALVNESNRRLDLNLKRLNDLYDSVKADLFQKQKYDSRIVTQSLADLNLWGHTAVSVGGDETAADTGCSRTEILVLGGYGTGPRIADLPINSDVVSPSAQPKRSEKVYRLRAASTTGQWEKESWEEVPLASTSLEDSKGQLHGIEVEPMDWFARQGAASCVLSLADEDVWTASVVAVFGGRKGPAHPLGDLVLLEYAAGASSCGFLKPTNTRGKPPDPRWGHSFTSLSCGGQEGNNLAVLVGGRNDHTVLADDAVFVLSLVRTEGRNRCLQWDKVILPSNALGRFHHATVAIDDHVFVFGGLSEVDNLLETFSEENESTPFVCAFTLSHQPLLVDVKGMMNNTLRNCFGLQTTIIEKTTGSRGMRDCQILLSGGVSSSDDKSENPCTVLNLVEKGVHAWEIETVCTANDDSTCCALGPLVHHASVALPAANGTPISRVACVGGGACGFAFRPAFRQSCLLSFRRGVVQEDSNLPTVLPPDVSRAKTTRLAPSSGATSISLANNPVAQVIYVLQQNAKTVKNQLEGASLLDMRHRMGPADPTADLPSSSSIGVYIAIPITNAAVSLLAQPGGGANTNMSSSSWMSLVEGSGEQELAFRTAVFARHKKKE